MNLVKLEAKARLFIVTMCVLCVSYYTAFVWLEAQILSIQTTSIEYKIVKVAKAQEKPLTLEDKICKTFGSECKTAIAIAKAESGLKCEAQNVNTNGSIDLGLFQINSVHLKKGWKAVDFLNCDKNLAHAYEIYQGSGWKAWATYNNGAYKKYL